jgi:hypothetical protein
MSIRTRVLSTTLGLAVAGLIVTVQAGEDKILIVRDGSVDAYVNNSHLEEKREDKHKWSKKADRVQIFEDATSAGACTTPVTEPKSAPMEFRQVVLRIRDQDTKEEIAITAANEGFLFKKLKLRMPAQWQFVFKQYKYSLLYGNQNQERNLKLEQVVVTASDDAGTVTTYPAQASKTTLCVRFSD